MAVGARVRARGERATNDGVRPFALGGVVESVDSGRFVLRGRSADAPLDTIALHGVRRLEVFGGRRRRRERVLLGAGTAAAAAAVAWLVARQTLEPEWSDVLIPDPSTGSFQTLRVVGPPPALIGRLRTSIPIAAIAGGLLGSVIGAERWTRVPIPQSVFPEAR